MAEDYLQLHGQLGGNGKEASRSGGGGGGSDGGWLELEQVVAEKNVRAKTSAASAASRPSFTRTS